MRVFITGGSGAIGSALTSRLVERGHRVTVASRHPSPAAGADGVVLDLATGEGLESVAGHDVIVHLASDPARARLVDVDGTARLLEAAARHGVGHFVALSIVGVDDHPFPYYRAKAEMERLVAGSPVPWTIFRATQFHTFVPRLVSMLPPIGLVPYPHRVSIQPVDEADVTGRLVEIVECGPSGRVADLGGPEVIPFRRLAADVLRARRLRRLLVPVPVPGAVGRAFRDGRMSTPNRSDGRRWSDYVATLQPARDGVGRAAMTLAVALAVTALWMLVWPEGFHSVVAPFGPANDHFIRDTATFVLPVIAGLWVAADRRSWRRPVFGIAMIQNGMHLLNHIADIADARPVWVGVANAVALAVFELVLWRLWRASLPSPAPVRTEEPVPA